MSQGKRFFPDRRSFIVSSVVIVLLVLFAVVVTDRNNVRRLNRHLREAEAEKEACYDLIEERFGYAGALVRTIAGQVDTKAVEEVLARWDGDPSIDEASALYTALDEELALLQRKAVEHDSYRAWSPYFERIHALELKLIEVSADYQDRAAYYNAQKSGFPALLVARRHKLEDLLLFDFGPSLKGRP
ncbi:MAG: hypothetical protein GX911_03850 [Spirochaetales bacterium]|nr:hypothetical protein [Spirochaetales bacterium]